MANKKECVHPSRVVHEILAEAERQNISQNDLARIAGWSRGNVTELKRGRASGTLNMLECLARALNCRLTIKRIDE